MNFTKMTFAAAAIASVSLAGAAHARDQISIVGSSTVFPYSQAAAEQYAVKTGRPAPVVESTGTGGGMKIFCQGIGVDQPDLTGASRAMKASEWELCQKNGVTDISEALLGYDGLAVAHVKSAGDLDLSERDIFLALAAKVPNKAGDGVIANPYKTWNEVNSSLPNQPILVMGPPPTSGTRDAFVELAMWDGCMEVDYFKKGAEAAKKAKTYKKENCTAMRQDGLFIEAGENDNLIVQRLKTDKDMIGLFGYSFLYENLDSLKPVLVNGVEASFETIGDQTYPIARPMFFYVKNAHRGVIPGLDDFIAEYVSDDAMGAGGYLSERGMVPVAPDVLKAVQETMLNAKPMTRYTN